MSQPHYILDLYSIHDTSKDKKLIGDELRKYGYKVEVDDQGVLVKDKIIEFLWGKDHCTLFVEFEGGKQLVFYITKHAMNIDLVNEGITIKRKKEIMVQWNSDGLYIQTDGV